MENKKLPVDYSGLTKEQLNTLFTGSAIAGNVSEMKSAVENGADPNYQFDNGATTLFLVVSSSGNRHVVKALLELGARVDLNCHDGMSPLFSCVIFEHYHAAHLLLEAGANPYEKGPTGVSPYDIAVHRNDYIFKEIFEKFGGPPADQENSFWEPATAEPRPSRVPQIRDVIRRITAFFWRPRPESGETDEKARPSLR